MAKKGKKKQDEEVIEAVIKPYRITKGSIRDSFCDFTIETLDGLGIGNTSNVKGANMFMDSLQNSFTKLNKHFACIDDVFNHAEIEVDNIDSMSSHHLTGLYEVDGFTIKGSVENESIKLHGSKKLSCGGRSSFDTPPILLDALSGYKWYNELKEVSDLVRKEIEMYNEGNYIVEEDVVDPKQASIFDQVEEEVFDKSSQL